METARQADSDSSNSVNEFPAAGSKVNRRPPRGPGHRNRWQRPRTAREAAGGSGLGRFAPCQGAPVRDACSRPERRLKRKKWRGGEGASGPRAGTWRQKRTETRPACQLGGKEQQAEVPQDRQRRGGPWSGPSAPHRPSRIQSGLGRV
ncbi:hypothetical protein NDU88_002345 [Pleurodeles waltl]|uniref:Uncharacterized protein n=1 Tax=Pleurodeles waltl TaxID=8319 RepID=A0AAV7L3D6_PLEWA|nr:hypothetical protein NDU88_002345 [Pleurodeles waltl]